MPLQCCPPSAFPPPPQVALSICLWQTDSLPPVNSGADNGWLCQDGALPPLTPPMAQQNRLKQVVLASPIQLLLICFLNSCLLGCGRVASSCLCSRSSVSPRTPHQDRQDATGFVVPGSCYPIAPWKNDKTSSFSRTCRLFRLIPWKRI